MDKKLNVFTKIISVYYIIYSLSLLISLISIQLGFDKVKGLINMIGKGKLNTFADIAIVYIISIVMLVSVILILLNKKSGILLFIIAALMSIWNSYEGTANFLSITILDIIIPFIYVYILLRQEEVFL
ncbi:MAG: hypothetical protein GX275_09355 [Clostridiales bacterium]|nr:hypothetical protein [Clostridiales bacterium]